MRVRVRQIHEHVLFIYVNLEKQNGIIQCTTAIDSLNLIEYFSDSAYIYILLYMYINVHIQSAI